MITNVVVGVAMVETQIYFVMLIYQGIGIEKLPSASAFLKSIISVRYRTKTMSDCTSLVQYQTSSGIVTFSHSETGLTGSRIDQHSCIPAFT
jgi:hypothetical protein